MTVEAAATAETTAASPAAAASAASTPNPTPNAAPAAATPNAETPQEFSFESTGYANADYALGVIGKAGIGPEHPAVVAAYEGDFSQLKHLLAVKAVPGAAELGAMLEQAYNDHNTKTAQTEQELTQKVYDMAGGQEQWEQVAQWARENADEGEKEALNDLFGNPKYHTIAASYLLSLYDKHGGVREASASVTGTAAPAARAAASADNTPISRAEFAAKGRELYAKYGENYINSAEYAALGRRVSR